MKPHRVGILSLLVIGVAVAILLSCSIEEAQPTPTKTPAFVPTPTATPSPIRTLTARQQEAIDFATGRKSVAIPIPTLTPARLPPPTLTARQQETFDYLTGRKSIGTPTPAPTPTATPFPTPTPIPTPTATPVPATVGERQLDWFKERCKEGNFPRGDTEYGRLDLGTMVKGELLLGEYSDHPNAVLGHPFTIAGSKWIPANKWLRVPLESDGAYSEGGTCISIIPYLPPWWESYEESDYAITIRLVPLSEVDLTDEQLTFTKGYHYISKALGYTGSFQVQMWWTGSDVPERRQNGQVISYNFSSKGPGRRDMSDPPTD